MVRTPSPEEGHKRNENTTEQATRYKRGALFAQRDESLRHYVTQGKISSWKLFFFFPVRIHQLKLLLSCKEMPQPSERTSKSQPTHTCILDMDAFGKSSLPDLRWTQRTWETSPGSTEWSSKCHSMDREHVCPTVYKIQWKEVSSSIIYSMKSPFQDSGILILTHVAV